MEKVKQAVFSALGSKRERVRFAIQKDGRLRELSLRILAECFSALGANLPEFPARKMRVRSESLPKVEILLMRTADMPGALKRKDIEFAFVGTDTLMEQGSRARIVSRLGEGKCSLQIFVRNGSRIIGPRQLAGRKIATPFPRLLRSYLYRRFIVPKRIEQVKSVETAVSSLDGGLDASFDAGCDTVETGASMRANNLKSIATIAEFETVLATSL